MTCTCVTLASDSLRDSWHPSLSPDGTIVALQGDSDFLSEGRPDSVNEICLYDIEVATFSRVTSASDSSGNEESRGWPIRKLVHVEAVTTASVAEQVVV